jgi:hypothetical protein
MSVIGRVTVETAQDVGVSDEQASVSSEAGYVDSHLVGEKGDSDRGSDGDSGHSRERGSGSRQASNSSSISRVVDGRRVG